MKEPCVYMLASRRDGVLYIGVTGSLHDRMAEHAQGLVPGFTKRYGVKQLVYYETHDSFDEAIRRETQLKKWKRAWKVRLIETKPGVDEPIRSRDGGNLLWTRGPGAHPRALTHPRLAWMAACAAMTGTRSAGHPLA